MFIEVKGEFDFGRSMVRSEVETRMISVNELRVVKLFFFLLFCFVCFVLMMLGIFCVCLM